MGALCWFLFALSRRVFVNTTTAVPSRLVWIVSIRFVAKGLRQLTGRGFTDPQKLNVSIRFVAKGLRQLLGRLDEQVASQRFYSLCREGSSST